MAQATKVFVTGSSELPDNQIEFALELGERLMKETSAILVTGGLASRGEGKRPAVDSFVAEAARRALASDAEAMARIITMLPEPGRDHDGLERIQIGCVVHVSYAGPRTRRYSMVLSSDAVVAIGGGDATREVLDLAYVAGKPLIPVPSTKGSALECWNNYNQDLLARLKPTKEELEGLLDQEHSTNGVTACLKILQRILRPRCFVAMPFLDHELPNTYETIEAVLLEHGYQAVRMDREKFSGNIVEEIWDSIRHCDLAIVDLTRHKPNVYYEMGIAHALNKPTLIMIHSSNGMVPDDIPFDIRVQRILPYGSTQSLRAHLKAQLPTIGVSRA